MYIFAQAVLLLDWSDITLVFFSNLHIFIDISIMLEIVLQ